MLTGFLGSGKTTLLNHLLTRNREENGGLRFAVIENEFGEVGIDEHIIDKAKLTDKKDDEVIEVMNARGGIQPGSTWIKARRMLGFLHKKPSRLPSPSPSGGARGAPRNGDGGGGQPRRRAAEPAGAAGPEAPGPHQGRRGACPAPARPPPRAAEGPAGKGILGGVGEGERSSSGMGGWGFCRLPTTPKGPWDCPSSHPTAPAPACTPPRLGT